MEKLECAVERITFRNTENGYSVLRCRADGYRQVITAVGCVPDVHVGSILLLSGDWKTDKKYGRQFAFTESEETLPATAYGIEKYLGSGLIKGIGPGYAKRIVDKFGVDTLDIIENSPERLKEVKGMKSALINRILEGWSEQKEIRNIMLFLQGHDVSTSHAAKIFAAYGKDSIKNVMANPYRLADDIWGIGFLTADTIAQKLGFDKEKYVRIRAGILYALGRLSEEGHCYATSGMLKKAAVELLGVDESLVSMTLDDLIKNRDVILDTAEPREEAEQAEAGEQDNTAIYLPPLFFSEFGTTKRLMTIAGTPVKEDSVPGNIVSMVEQRTSMTYETVQRQAIETAVRSKVTVITGGPGTGKTTTTLGIIEAFRIMNKKVLLCAPTGRAAKRMSEVANREAKTIHRLLEANPVGGYQRNEKNRIEGDVLIVDECSMIDVLLMYNLLKAVPDNMRIIFVGDVDQLPSVGPGNVLRDIIESGRFPVVRLTVIFRQARESRIILNAHRVNSGEMPDLSNGRNTDFFFVEEGDPDLAAQRIVELVQTKLPGYFRIGSSDIQVLTPMRKGSVGAINLNQVLQQSLNPPESGKHEIQRGGTVFRSGDRVMQIRNNYSKEVFNGDMGTVFDADEGARTLSVNFDGRLVSYDQSDMDELVLAYAATVHKSQGSEYPVVVMPIEMQHYIMLEKNLVYTGITRAKRGLVIVGTKKAVACAVHRQQASARNTMLKQRLESWNI